MRAVIFDFDGTLADSFTAVIALAHRLTHREQLADMEYVNKMRANNVGLREALKLLELHKWQWPWLVQRGRRLMRHHINQIPLFVGIDDALASLDKEHYALYIISSNSKVNVEHFLLQKGILQYFSKVYGSIGLFNKASALKRVLKAHKLDPASTIYVGDEVRDIEAAKAVNMPVVAVAWGYNSEDLLAKSAPTVIAHSPKQLAKIIIEWGKTL